MAAAARRRAELSAHGPQPALERLLAGSPPFSALPADERQALAAALRPRTFRPGETVFSEGEAADSSWLVVEGTARILSYYGDSRMMELERLGPGQLFGRYCRVGARAGCYHCTAVAGQRLLAARVSDEAYERWFARYPEFARSVYGCCAARLSAMQEMVGRERDSVERRVARALLAAYREQGAEVSKTRRELALEIGAALETVFRALARMRARGWLETGRRSISIKRPDLLAVAARGRAPR